MRALVIVESSQKTTKTNDVTWRLAEARLAFTPKKLFSQK
jgi:hypothetical protein